MQDTTEKVYVPVDKRARLHWGIGREDKNWTKEQAIKWAIRDGLPIEWPWVMRHDYEYEYLPYYNTVFNVETWECVAGTNATAARLNREYWERNGEPDA